jgi:protein SCO1/2
MAVVLALLLLVVPLAAEARERDVTTLRDAFDPATLRIDEGRYLGRPVPDVRVLTEEGPRQLHDLLAGKPALLLLAYYTCHGPCPTAIQNLARSTRSLGGEEFRVLVLSFDRNDTMSNLVRARALAGEPRSHWTFGLLDPEANDALTGGVGFRYFFSERDQMFIHPVVLIALSPRGEVTRYLYGAALEEKEIRLALLEAGKGVARPGDLLDLAQLACYKYDPDRSRYVLQPAVLFGFLGIGLLGATGLIAFFYGRVPKGGKSS